MGGSKTVRENRELILPSWASNLPSNWTWYDLAELCSDIIDCPHSTPEIVDDGPFKMARTSDILTGVFRAQQARRVSEATFRERIRRAEPEYGDLLYSREGTYFGIAAEVPPNTKVCLGQRMVLLRPNAGRIDQTFLRFWLNSPGIQAHIHGQRDGSVAERLNLPTIRGLPVCIPSLPEQRAIAHILGTLDDKIELNRRMNETLEAMARARFKSCFVDFDPVRAKMEGRWRPGQSLPGLPAHLYDLFPDRLVPSELGEIPDGWGVSYIGDLAALSREGVKPEDFVDEVFDHYSIPAFDDGRAPKPEPGGVIKSNKLIVPRDSVLVSKLNPRIPRVWLPAVHDARRSICSTEFLVALPKPGLSREYLYSLLSSRDFMDEFATLVTGTSGSHQRVKPQVFINVTTIRPPEALVAVFSGQSKRLLAEVVRNSAESRILSALRDALLPRLISGALRVFNENGR